MEPRGGGRDMAHVTIRFLDLMDARPIPEADVETVFRVTRLGLQLDDAPGGSGKPIEVPETVASVRRTARTDAAGQVGFDLGRNLFEAALTDKGPRDRIVTEVEVTHFDRLGLRPASRSMRGQLEPDAAVTIQWPVDLGRAITGHVTRTSARLWFQLRQPPTPAHVFTCVVRAPDGGERREVVAFEDAALTAVVDVGDLDPDTTYAYHLEVAHERGGRQVLANGRLRTDGDRDDLAFAFGSCHKPFVPVGREPSPDASHQSLNRWQALAQRVDDELLLLLGDQIYGDEIDKLWPDDAWFDRYRKRYEQLWAYEPMREVLRSRPTYMILDDHDVADDYGHADKFHSGEARRRADAALEAYALFQHRHNPGDHGPDPRHPRSPLHFSFRRGPAAFFVMDGRTQRGVDEAFPVFGRAQWRDIERWAASDEVREADIICFGASVPPALLPTETLREIFEDLVEEGSAALFGTVGGLAGFALGWFAGPFGAAAGAGLGAAALGAVGFGAGHVASEAAEEKLLLLGRDLGERWDAAANQRDLVRLLDLLFDLAAGVHDGRPRAVFILSGDIHAGTIHNLRSRRPRHARNPVILQFTSSAISHAPVDEAEYRDVVSRIDADLDLDLTDLNVSRLWDDDQKVVDTHAFERTAARYALDSEGEQVFWAEYLGLVIERTFGSLRAKRLGGRRWRFDIAIEGERSRQAERIEMDLDHPDRVERTTWTDVAEFEDVQGPDELEPSATGRAELVVRNKGLTTWRPSTHELRPDLEPAFDLSRIAVPEETPPGARVRFSVPITAPDREGTFRLEWRITRRIGATIRSGTAAVTVRVRREGNPERCGELADRLRDAERRRDVLEQTLQELNQGGGGFGGPPGGGPGGIGGGPGGRPGGVGGGLRGGPSAKGDIGRELDEVEAEIRSIAAEMRRLDCR